MNVAIITARVGSKSITNKNIFEVGGQPLIYYPIKAAQEATKVDKIYISTDGPEIAAVGREYDCDIIERPGELRGDTVNHGDVIKHATEYVDDIVDNLENVILLLGNTVMIDGVIIDKSLSILEDNSSYDSVMTVWEAQDDHPFRAMSIDEEGFLKPYGDQGRKVSTERQSYPSAFYYDQGIWTFRKQCVQSQDGPNPWWWMGKNCFPIKRNWVTGRDIHTHFDLGVTEWWVNNQQEIQNRIAKSPYEF